MAFDWGNVPEWVAAAGAVTALIFARSAAIAARKTSDLQSVQIAELQKETEKRSFAERQKLAEKVAIWIATENPNSGEKAATVRYLNASGLPIYGLRVYCFTPGDVVEKRYFVNGPRADRVVLTQLTTELREALGDQRAGDLIGSGRLAASCRFRDSTGLWWYRTADGALHEAADGEEAAALARAAGPTTTSSALPNPDAG